MASSDSPIIARRTTRDGMTVLVAADGYAMFRTGRIITSGLNRDAANIFMGDVSIYDADEARRLANAAKRAVKQHPNDLSAARRAMRVLMGPPPQANPISTREVIFVTTGVLTVIALIYEISNKAKQA